MVYDKARSGDPDYDDKQPVEQHAGRLVTAGDGREVLLTEAAGPVDPVTGEHVPMDGPTAEDLDNRPAPGEVAKEASSVQTYSAEDTPAADRTNDEDAVQPEPAKAAADSTKTTARPSSTNTRTTGSAKTQKS